MCIIVYKPKGVAIPDTLKTCWTNNDDGAGLMYNNKKDVIIRKGFMSWKSYKKAVEMIPDAKNKDVVFHFRISTGGGIVPELTHPYKVCNDYEDMRKLWSINKLSFCHNGILKGFDSSNIKKNLYNDTMNFNKNFLSQIGKNFHNNFELLNSIENLIDNNKLAIMTPADVVLLGDFNKYNGCYYSNYSYKEYKTLYTSYYGGLYDNIEGEYLKSYRDYDKYNKKCECCLEFTDKLYDSYNMKVCKNCKTLMEGK